MVPDENRFIFVKQKYVQMHVTKNPRAQENFSLVNFFGVATGLFLRNWGLEGAKRRENTSPWHIPRVIHLYIFGIPTSILPIAASDWSSDNNIYEN